MNQKEIDINLLELFNHLWGKRRLIIKWTIIGMFVGLIIAFSIPKEYKATTDIVPENIYSAKSSSLSSLAALTGVASPENIDGISYNIYPHIITQPTFVMELANVEVENNGRKMTFLEFTLEEQNKPWWIYIITSPLKVIDWISGFLSDNETEENNKIIDIQNLTQQQQRFLVSLQNQISTTLDKETGILQVGLQTQDPNISKQILDTILVNLQTYITDYKTNKTRIDYEVTKVIAQDAKENFYKYDSIYADIVDKNKNLSMATASLNIQRAAENRSIAFSSYQQVQQKLESLKLKIQEQSVIITILTPPMTPFSASIPNKPLIIIAFILVFCLGYCLVDILKYVIKL